MILDYLSSKTISKNYMQISNKISNLNKIKKNFNIPDYIVFSVKDFMINPEEVYKKCKKKFKDKIIVRSAFSEEDSKSSLAGKFISVPNIYIGNKSYFFKSVNRVISSYKSKKINQNFFVQEMMSDAKLSGVIFTVEQTSGHPVTTINFTTGNKTDLITSGTQNGFSYKYLNLYKPQEDKFLIKKLNNVILRLKRVFKKENLDIEFGVSKNNVIKIFQVRQINKYKKIDNIKIYQSYKLLEKKLDKILNDKSFLKGKYTLFSTMTDWNPAEIIGLKPNPLSYSIYKELITDSIWARSRGEFGYSDLGETPLMFSFLGTPFIDIRADFNSFIPANLNENLKEKMVNYYLSEFKKRPERLYDKVESDLIISAIDFNYKKKIKKFKILTKEEETKLRNEFREITNNSFKLLYKSINKYQSIDNYLEKLKKNNAYTINNIYHLINICKSLGTLPFANIARCAFISVNFLTSLVSQKIISKKDKDDFLNSLNSVTSEILESLKKDPHNKFIEKYGHLRPNTYDINSNNYKDNYNNYFSNTNTYIKKSNFSFSSIQRKKIEKLIKLYKLDIDFYKFNSFLIDSIVHREKSKYEFTKIINRIFEEIKVLSKRFNISEKDLCYIDLNTIKNLYNNFSIEIVKNQLLADIKKNKKDFYFNKNFNVPNIIIEKEDIYSFFKKKNNATFITDKKIMSNVVCLDNKLIRKNINNKIVCIRNADPGYDFIFTKKINGLITEFGGPNSHMSIRCNELQVPAAIGVGGHIYEKISKSDFIELDCNIKKISY